MILQPGNERPGGPPLPEVGSRFGQPMRVPTASTASPAKAGGIGQNQKRALSAPQTATFRWTHAPQGRRESSQGWSEAEPLVKPASPFDGRPGRGGVRPRTSLSPRPCRGGYLCAGHLQPPVPLRSTGGYSHLAPLGATGDYPSDKPISSLGLTPASAGLAHHYRFSLSNIINALRTVD